MASDLPGSPTRGNAGLVDVIDRESSTRGFVAGDIKVSLAEVELLTIRIRLMICSIDRAEEIGLDWWRYDRHLSPGREQVMQNGAPRAPFERATTSTPRTPAPARARRRTRSGPSDSSSRTVTRVR